MSLNKDRSDHVEGSTQTRASKTAHNIVDTMFFEMPWRICFSSELSILIGTVFPFLLDVKITEKLKALI